MLPPVIIVLTLRRTKEPEAVGSTVRTRSTPTVSGQYNVMDHVMSVFFCNFPE